MLRLPFLSLFLSIGSVSIAFMLSAPSLADVVPDTTLPENSRVDRQGNVFRIEGGTERDSNLFHSFQEFSILRGETAHFNNLESIANIFARVTGLSRSEINGMIQANGSANLFLINPNGILFGRNASLNIGGSFLATTADQILFADGTEFSAIDPSASPMLTVSVPVGLQFGSNPQPIVNRSRFPEGSENPIGLRVRRGETLALIGGQIDFSGGTATAPSGRIELGAVETNNLPTQVNLSLTNEGLRLDYRDVQRFQDIQFSNGAVVDTTGEPGGSMQIQGRNITLTDRSFISSQTSGAESGGAIIVNATQSVILRDGSNISTIVAGDGQAGDIVITAELVQIIGTAPPTQRSDDPTPSAIGSQVGNPDQTTSELREITGGGGDVTIDTRRLIARDGGSIEASTFARGSAGNIVIRASESIELSGTEVFGTGVREQISSGIYAQVGLGAIPEAGDAGRITIETGELTVLGGAQISSAARTGGRGGNVIINADLIRISGASPNATEVVGRSGIFVSAEEGTNREAGQLNITTGDLIVDNRGEISASNFGPDRGGTITIDADRVVIQNDGIIRATSFNDGLAGDVIITANLLSLDNGQITAETQAGEEANANIRLQNLDLLLMRNQSEISARAFGSAGGGNVFISAPDGFIVAATNGDSDIIASAFAGQGGTIEIETQSIIGLQERRDTDGNGTNDIDASSEFGAPGLVTINQLEIDPSEGIVELPSSPIDAASLIAQTCPRGSNIADNQLSEFILTGRGGLPPNPTDPNSGTTIQTDWVALPSDAVQEDAVQESVSSDGLETSTPIVEAQGWVIGENGEVRLVAQTPADDSETNFFAATCGAQ
ncbi:MAG: S-layer family protein [Cyanobacteria bacterium CRU_2_1]|nr:S-layer family protein [Cyanobacteria bacterium RU_5_0]NJR58156.1 S-layer family protein [Cyanobacteria bacterium CRU_2_1]